MAPTITVVIVNCLIYALALDSKLEAYSRRHNHTYLLQIITISICLTCLFFNYYALIIPLLLPSLVCNAITIVFFSIVTVLLVGSLYFRNEFLIMLCDPPHTVYRCSQTNFKDSVCKIKLIKNTSFHVQNCIICYSQKASTILNRCLHLTYC